jgi:hypothetical protein
VEARNLAAVASTHTAEAQPLVVDVGIAAVVGRVLVVVQDATVPSCGVLRTESLGILDTRATVASERRKELILSVHYAGALWLEA